MTRKNGSKHQKKKGSSHHTNARKMDYVGGEEKSGTGKRNSGEKQQGEDCLKIITKRRRGVWLECKERLNGKDAKKSFLGRRGFNQDKRKNYTVRSGKMGRAKRRGANRYRTFCLKVAYEGNPAARKKAKLVALPKANQRSESCGSRKRKAATAHVNATTAHSQQGEHRGGRGDWRNSVRGGREWKEP